MRSLLFIAVLLLALSCEGTPLPGDEDDEDTPETIDPLATSLEDDEVGIALQQLAVSLTTITDSRELVLEALQSPSVELDERSLNSAFRSLTANEFEIGWLAYLLTLATAEEEPAEAAVAEASLRSLATSAFSEAVAVNDIRSDLALGAVTLNQARSALTSTFDALRPTGEDDLVVLLPEDVPEPVISLTRAGPDSQFLAEHSAGFTTVASAVEQATTAEILAGEDVSSARVELAALNRLALLSGRGSDPPTSPFGSYVLPISSPSQIVYGLSGRQTVGVIPEADLPVVALDAGEEGAIGVTVLDVEGERGDLQVRSSTRSILTGHEPHEPAFGRPNASLQSGFGLYQLLVEVPFVNPASTPFHVTCVVPSLGARITMTAASQRAEGDLRASGRLVLAPTQLAALAEESQIVCAGSHGTVESGRIAIPVELVPDLETEE
jgi:hypothetical protein